MNCLRKPNEPMPTEGKSEAARPRALLGALLRGGLRSNLTPRFCAVARSCAGTDCECVSVLTV